MKHKFGSLRYVRRRSIVAAISLAVLLVGVLWAFDYINLPPRAVTFGEPKQALDAFNFLEITAQISAPHAGNPFTGASIHGTFKNNAGIEWQVDGFCDSDDGSVYRIRFMPQAPGDYTYSVVYRQGWSRHRTSGKFHVVDAHRRGVVRVDPNNRWHFVWQGTGEHYFFNGTTAYWLVGFRDEHVIESAIERLHRLKINRMRVTVAGRTDTFYGEPLMVGDNWTPLIAAWRTRASQRYLHYLGRVGQKLGIGGIFDDLANLGAQRDLYHPGFDYRRFDVAYWQKFERALKFARDRDMVFSLVLDMRDSGVHLDPESRDEQRMFKYAVARLAAFSNVTWDLGDDLDAYRSDQWTQDTGTLIKAWDPYKHLATSHPIHNEHQDRASDWFDFTSFQEWSRNQHEFMLAQRKEQQRTGRIIPQTNEEYGYEDHYPEWAIGGLGSDSSDTLRRTAWEIAMAGAYGTTGETAKRGTNILPDTGGGWMNGRGDDTMTMLQGYAHMVDFFTSFDWWKTEPHDELVNNKNYCLAKPGEVYAVYLPRGGDVTVQVVPGNYSAAWWDPLTGKKIPIPQIGVNRSSWTSPQAPANGDWALLLKTD
jgi:hypothetical protein